MLQLGVLPSRPGDPEAVGAYAVAAGPRVHHDVPQPIPEWRRVGAGEGEPRARRSFDQGTCFSKEISTE